LLVFAREARVAEALAAGGELATVLAAIRAKEARRDEIQHAITQLGRPVGRVDVRSLRSAIEARVRDWRGLLRKHAEQASSF
jgi:hypothetical protein